MSRENRAGKWQSCAPRTAEGGCPHLGGSQYSCVVENLPQTPESCGGTSPNVQEGFQVQLGYEVSLAVGADYEWALALHQDYGGMEVEFVWRSHGRSGRDLGIQVGISFAAQQIGFRLPDEPWPDPRQLVALGNRILFRPGVFPQRAHDENCVSRLY